MTIYKENFNRFYKVEIIQPTFTDHMHNYHVPTTKIVKMTNRKKPLSS